MEGVKGISGPICMKGIYPPSPIWDTIDKVDYYQFCSYVQDNLGLDSRKDGWNAATYCAQKELWMFAKVLLEHGQMIQDHIPLVKSIKDQDLNIITMLMKYGCYNTGFRDHYKNAVFATGNKTIIEIFAKHYKENNQNLFRGVDYMGLTVSNLIENANDLKTYIDYGFNVTKEDDSILKIYLGKDYSVNNGNIIRSILENGGDSSLLIGTNYDYLLNKGSCLSPGNHYISVPGPCLNSGDVGKNMYISAPGPCLGPINNDAIQVPTNNTPVGAVGVIGNQGICSTTPLRSNQGRYGCDGIDHGQGFRIVLSEEQRRIDMERQEKLLQEKRDKFNNHPGKIMFDAVKSGNFEVVQFLLQSNIPLDCRDEYDRDLLYHSIVNEDTNIFELLLSKMKVDKKYLPMVNDTNFTSIVLKHIGDDLELAKHYATVFLNKVDEDEEDEEEDEEEDDEYYEILEKFLTKFPQVIPDILDMVEWKNEIKIILKTGFNIHYNNDFILRHVASNFDDLDAVKYCIERGANFNVVDESGCNIKNWVADSNQEIKDYVNSIFQKTYLVVIPRVEFKDFHYPKLIHIQNYVGFDITNVDLLEFDMNFHIKFLSNISDHRYIPHIITL